MFDDIFVDKKFNCLYIVIFTVLLLVMIILSDSMIDIFIIGMYLLMLFVWMDVDFFKSLKDVWNIKYILLLLFLVVSFIGCSLYIGFIWFLKFIIFCLFVILFNRSFAISNVIYGMFSLLSPLCKVIDVNKVSVSFILFFEFFYSLIYSWKDFKLGNKYIENKTINIEEEIKDFFAVFDRCMVDTRKLRDNLYVKNFGGNLSTINYRLNKWQKTDTILLVMNIVTIMVVFIY